jgi:glycerate 2-kinase
MDVRDVTGRTLFEDARSIYETALASVAPERLIRTHVSLDGDLLRVRGETRDLSLFEGVYVIAFGKAAVGMGTALAEVLGDRLTEGLIVSPGPPSGRRGRLEFLEAPHPLPDGRSVDAAQRALELAQKAGDRDLVLVAISGGGSSLLCLPAEGVSLDDKKVVIDELLRAGADIRELNVVRKHLSRIKGGRLARAAHPATVVTLVISDVIGDDLESIASGPTYWDSTTFADAMAILKEREVWKRAPAAVKAHVERGVAGDVPETLRKDDPVFAKADAFVVGNNLTALRGARREAERLGYETYIVSAADRGEARKAARDNVAFLSTLACSMSSAPKATCLLAGGELTVTVRGTGMGGRNTEYVLASLVEIRESGVEEAFCGACHFPGTTSGSEEERGVDWVILSVGTDGIDGPTDAAGAWIDAATFKRVHDLGLAPARALNDNDSYTFLRRTGNLIVTGPTGTNVMDVRVMLIAPRR